MKKNLQLFKSFDRHFIASKKKKGFQFFLFYNCQKQVLSNYRVTSYNNMKVMNLSVFKRTIQNFCYEELELNYKFFKG